MSLPIGLLLDVRPRPTGPYELGWGLHPTVFIGVAVLTALYLWGIGPARRKYNLGAPVSGWRITSFAAAMIVLLGSLNGPMHDLSDYYLFSVHMLQHLLLTLLFPPLLIAAIPGWLLTPILRRPLVLSVARFLTRPLVAGSIYTVSIALWHVVSLYQLMMREHDVHVFTHIMFMVTAVIMWWPVMSPSPELPRLSYGLGMLYIFLVSIPMQVLGAIITFADAPLYQWYVEAPRVWGLSALDDQKTGGLLMWVPGNLWMMGAIGVLFFQWAASEKDTPRTTPAHRAA